MTRRSDQNEKPASHSRQRPAHSFPKQRQARPSIDSEMKPVPRSAAPGLRGAGKLQGKVALITGGPVRTPLNVADQDADEVAVFGRDRPIKCLAQPDEVAPAIVFLASDIDSSYITGEVPSVLGGNTTAA